MPAGGEPGVMQLQFDDRTVSPPIPMTNMRSGCGSSKCGATENLTQKPTSPGHRQPLTAFETHNGRSTFAARAALHAPILPLDEVGSNGLV